MQAGQSHLPRKGMGVQGEGHAHDGPRSPHATQPLRARDENMNNAAQGSESKDKDV